MSKRALFLLLSCSLGCKREAPAEDSPSKPTSAPSVSAEAKPKKQPKAKVALPPVDAKDKEVTFAGKQTTATVCKLDEAAPVMADKDWWFHALTAMAVDQDGALYVVDHEQKLRKYRNRAKDGCELALDKSFGEGGIQDFQSPRGSIVNSVGVDDKGAVYFSWNKAPKRIVEGKVTDFCSGFVRADVWSPLVIADGNLVEGQGCNGKYAKSLLNGFAPDVPQYDEPHVIGLYGKELVSEGIEKEKGKSVHKVGVHGLDGKRRLALGGHEDDAVWSLKHATTCGDDLCVLDAPLSSASVLRWTREGKFLGKLKLSTDADLSMNGLDLGWTKAGLYVGGSMRGDKLGHVGVIVFLPGV